jgi:hypothetical protein
MICCAQSHPPCNVSYLWPHLLEVLCVHKVKCNESISAAAHAADLDAMSPGSLPYMTHEPKPCFLAFTGSWEQAANNIYRSGSANNFPCLLLGRETRLWDAPIFWKINIAGHVLHRNTGIAGEVVSEHMIMRCEDATALDLVKNLCYHGACNRNAVHGCCSPAKLIQCHNGTPAKTHSHREPMQPRESACK